jgi:dihydrofolate synthase / folylpolyglutamate synthase
MNFEIALEWLWNLENFERTPPKDQQAYTLDRMTVLLLRLGNPQNRIPMIHVAGSKGKGSIVAMIESVLRAQGYRTGMYISPHLYTARERIRAGGEMIGETAFTALIERIQALSASLKGLTTFEALTAMAFVYFVEQGVDIGVVEVGLGGRLDATNLIAHPLVSVITPLSLEHTAILGNTLAEIAYEKGGIIKAGSPVVTAPQSANEEALLRNLAMERNAPFHKVEECLEWVRTGFYLEGQTLDMWTREGAGEKVLACSSGWSIQGLKIPFLGRHQIVNAATAVAALLVIRAAGFPWIEPSLFSGLSQVEWPVRSEVIRREPFMLVDGAHNGASAEVLSKTLEEVKDKGLAQWEQLWLVLGVSNDKQLEDILRPLLPLLTGIVLTKSQHPRASLPDAMLERLKPLLDEYQKTMADSKFVRIAPDVRSSLILAMAEAGNQGAVVVAGSLFTAAEARAVLLEKRY